MKRKKSKSTRTPDITHRIMSSIPSKNTRPEVLLRKTLWHKKLRYRTNYSALPGKPDIVFTRQKVAVFCDGDFWHGHNWKIRGLSSLEEELSGYSEYWQKKILRNIERDEENNKALRSMGWSVVRLWESDIKNDVEGCAQTVQEILFDSMIKNSEIDISSDYF